MKQLAKVLASFSLAATMCLGVGFAADSPHPGENGTVDKAMETVPPIKKDVPKMGDTGIPQESLLQALLVAGGCYLVSDGVAVACKGGRRKPKKTAKLKNA